MTTWKYKDATGVERTGDFVDFSDRGGTDVTYCFRRADGTLDLVSGQRLKEAHLLKPTPIEGSDP